jgi:anti-anti-sigma factor
MPLSLDRNLVDGTLTIALAGEIDLSTRQALAAAIEDAFEQMGVTNMIVDMAGVTFMDCCGLGALIQGRALAEKRSCAYQVCGVTGLARKVMEMTGVLDMLCGTP